MKRKKGDAEKEKCRAAAKRHQVRRRRVRPCRPRHPSLPPPPPCTPPLKATAWSCAQGSPLRCSCSCIPDLQVDLESAIRQEREGLTGPRTPEAKAKKRVAGAGYAFFRNLNDSAIASKGFRPQGKADYFLNQSVQDQQPRQFFRLEVAHLELKALLMVETLLNAR